MDRNDIIQEFGSEDYYKGLQYVNQRRVKRLDVLKSRLAVELHAQVLGQMLYDVDVTIEDSGLSYWCDCPRCGIAGQCKHIVAALLEYIGQEEAEHPAAAAQAEQRSGRNLVSNTTARKLIQEAEQQSLPTSGMAETMGAVHLTPLVWTDDWCGEIGLNLTVGITRQYVVRNIRSFLNAVDEEAEVPYGKQLSFRHSLGAFDKPSQALIGLLRRTAAEYSQMKVSPFRDWTGSPARSIVLSPSGLDGLFDLYQGETLDAGSQGSLRFQEAQPELVATLQGRDGGMEVGLLEDALLLHGVQRDYLIVNSVLFPCTPELGELAATVLDGRRSYYFTGSPSLFFARADLPVFAAGVLPRLKRCFTVVGDEALLEDYTPDTPVLQYYLDWTGEALTARLKALYGDRSVPVEADGDPEGVRRNRLAERRGLSLLENWFGQDKDDAGAYRMEDEDRLYAFLGSGIAELQEQGEVYTTSAVQRLHAPQPKVRVGVSVSGGLLDLNIDTGAFPLEELAALAQAVRANRPYYRLKSGAFLSLDESGSLTRLAELKDGLGLKDRELASGSVELPLYRAPYLEQTLQGSESLRYSRDDGFRSLVRSFRTVADSDYTLPQQYQDILRPYQKTGFRWLKTLAQYGFGGILADDMGLGKTVQALSFLSSAKEEGNTLPSLVVCPASLVLNWGDECRKFAPELTVFLLSGTAAERRAQWGRVEGCDLAVISYDSLRRDVERLEEHSFYTCILDEAQYIKNHNTLSVKAVKRVRSKLRFAMTGTPVENRLSELWSIFDFLMPGYLYRYSEFQARLEKPITKERDQGAAKRLAALTNPFILRRMKGDVLKELPPKTESVRYVALSQEQRKLYTAVAMDGKNELQQAGAGGQEKLKVLVLLMRLRQICCDPRLCLDGYQGESAKLESCMELVSEALSGGHRILLFSQFTSMLELIRQRLEREGISCFVLEGSTPKRQRAELVERFNQGEGEVFLISLKAGGTGLNLTGADTVIHYDPWWNQAAQNQATDRAHRIGQRSAVQVYKLISKDTIEEKILDLQQRKQELADTVAGTEEGILALSSQELLELLE
ncbi:MAG: DEAD/DEAH box helicase [Clostridiales bacterium]|nr:DEAD/DEAH box helicase [Clostridiales bacterium]